jgi:putative membrane protein
MIFDLILEPVAILLNYWYWKGGIVPIQNYLAWFVLAVIISILYDLLKVSHKTKMPAYYLLIQGLFFIGIQLGLNYNKLGLINIF